MPRPPQINEEQDRCVSGRCSCHAEDIRQLFICSLPPSMSLSLLDSISVSFASNLCLSVSRLPSSPPQLLDDIRVFLGGQISRCFAHHGAFGFHLTAPVTCHSRGPSPTRSPLANRYRSWSKSSRLTALPQTLVPLAVSELTSVFAWVLEIWNRVTEACLLLLHGYPLFPFCFSSCHKVEAEETGVCWERAPTPDRSGPVEWVSSALWWTHRACGYAIQSTPT